MKGKEAVHEIKEKCIGCTRCVRACPVSAIRLINDKIERDSDKCISCGQCIKICIVGAIESIYDEFGEIFDNSKFKYRVALLSNVFIGQFPRKISYKMAVDALLKLGFDEVIDENMITGVMSPIFAEKLKKKKIRPLISSNCPAIVRLIQTNYPSLIPHILPLESSANILSAYYREYLVENKNLSPDEIGIFFVAPCSAQINSHKNPLGHDESLLDGALAMRDVYNKIMNICFYQDQEDLQKKKGRENLPKHENWGIYVSEGNQIKKGNFKTLAVSGLKGAKDILSKIEGGQLEYFDYVVLRSCTNGCVGGDLNVENPFLATNRINSSDIEFTPIDKDLFYRLFNDRVFSFKSKIKPLEINADNISIKEKIIKIKKNNNLQKLLPGKNCGICGCPTCADLAREIVDGKAKLSDCVFNIRENKKISLLEIVEYIEGQVFTKKQNLSEIYVEEVYVGDLLSDVMASAGGCQVWITIMQHQNSIAVASLLDIKAIIFAKDKKPDEKAVEKANEEGIVMIGSSHNSFKISGILHNLITVK